MRLSPGERSILAYFPSSSDAQSAAEALKAAGISEVQVDRVSRYGVKDKQKPLKLIKNKNNLTNPAETAVPHASRTDTGSLGCEVGLGH